MAQQSLDAPLPKGLSPKRLALLALALREVGTREKTGKNDGYVERYVPLWARGRGLPWCAWFVGFCWHEFFGVHPYGSHIGGVANLLEAAKKRHEALDLRAPRGLGPQPGDAFVNLHGDGTGHTGFILRVGVDGEMVNTAEGNFRNGVGIATRAIADIDFVINPYGRLANEHDPVGFERGLIDAPFAGNSVAGTR